LSGRRAWLAASTALLASVTAALVLDPSGPVTPDGSERLIRWGVLVGLPVLLSALAGGTLARRRVAALGCGLLPSAALVVLAHLVDVHSVGVHADWDLPLRVLGGTLLVALALRTRAAPGLTVLLASVWGMGLVELHPRGPAAVGGQGADRLVVLLTLDTARADAFVFNGEGRHAHTPHLAQLARQSTVFREAHSPIGFTGPAHASLLSGLQPWEHGVLSNGQVVPEDIPWLPSELQAAGWTTRAAVSSSVLDADLGFDRGFGAYDSAFTGRLGRSHPLLHFLGFRYLAGSAQQRSGGRTLSRLEVEPDGPTFLWLHLYDAHWPYAPSPEAAERRGLETVREIPEVLRSAVSEEGPDQRQGRAQYLAELDDMDGVVGDLLDRLPEDAVVLVVGDHGEAMGEGGRWFTHGSDPGEAISHVPMAVRAPGWPTVTVDTAVSTTRVADTLRVLCDLPGIDRLDPQPTVEPVASVAMRTLQVLPSANRGRFLGAELRLEDQELRMGPTGEFEGSTDERLVDGAEALRAATLSHHGAELEPGAQRALEALGYLE